MIKKLLTLLTTTFLLSQPKTVADLISLTGQPHESFTEREKRYLESVLDLFKNQDDLSKIISIAEDATKQKIEFINIFWAMFAPRTDQYTPGKQVHWRIRVNSNLEMDKRNLLLLFHRKGAINEDLLKHKTWEYMDNKIECLKYLNKPLDMGHVEDSDYVDIDLSRNSLNLSFAHTVMTYWKFRNGPKKYVDRCSGTSVSWWNRDDISDNTLHWGLGTLNQLNSISSLDSSKYDDGIGFQLIYDFASSQNGEVNKRYRISDGGIYHTIMERFDPKHIT